MWPFKQKEEKPVNPVIEMLEEELRKQKVAVEGTKMLIKEAKRGSEKEGTPFIETLPMRAYLRTVRFITSPFAGLHNRADQAYEHPEEYRRDRLLEETRGLLEECKGEVDPSPPKAKSLSAQAFHMIAEVEEEAKRSKWQKSTAILKELREEFKRLAPPKTEEGEALSISIEETMEATMEKVRAQVKKPRTQGV
jgi:hypothetical protein